MPDSAQIPQPEQHRAGDGIQAVALALRILEYLAAQRSSVGVTALAQALGMSKSRVYRHLRTLLDQGYVVQSADSEKYHVGARLVTLGRAVAENFDMPTLARPMMRELRDALGHPVVLSRPHPDGALVLATMLGTSQIEISVRQGSVLAFHCTAQGKLVLAYGDDSLLDRVFRSRLDLRTPDTISSLAQLRMEIAHIRERGWSMAPNEILIGINALAAPIFDAGGALAGVIALVDSVQFLEASPSEAQLRLLAEAAGRISRALGWRPSNPPSPET